MKRISLKVGDIFEVSLGDTKKGYVQYIGNDRTQLNSDVIRVFALRTESNAESEEIVKSHVEFYSHVTDVKAGIKDGSWKKVGHSDDIGDSKAPFFRHSDDYGNPDVKKSDRWYVWRMNEPMANVGKLAGENTRADIGVVTWPTHIVARMRTGKYHAFYPDYK